MKHAAKALICLGAIAALASCSAPLIKISVKREDSGTVLLFSQDWGLFSRPKAPCIDRIAILRDGTPDYDNPVWKIEPEREVQCLDIASVALGKVPKGWKETAPLSLKSGETYTVEVLGIGSGLLENVEL